MSDALMIVATTFIDHHTKEESYGYRAFDEYFTAYGNYLTKEQLDLPPLEFLAAIWPNISEELGEAIDTNVNEMDCDIEINGETISADDVKKVLDSI